MRRDSKEKEFILEFNDYKQYSKTPHRICQTTQLKPIPQSNLDIFQKVIKDSSTVQKTYPRLLQARLLPYNLYEY
jgi:hypothetical protein